MVSFITSPVPRWRWRHLWATGAASVHLYHKMLQALGFADAFYLAGQQCDFLGLAEPFYPGSFRQFSSDTHSHASFGASSVLSNTGDQSFILKAPMSVAFQTSSAPFFYLQKFLNPFL